MTRRVYDANVGLAWLLPHRRSQVADELLDRIEAGEDEGIVPPLFYDEVFSVLYRTYTSRMYRRNPEGPEYGWRTDLVTRPYLLRELEEALQAHAITPRSEAAVREMLNFVRNTEGRPGAAVGTHDDRVIAFGIAWQMRKHASFHVSHEPVFLAKSW